MKKVILFLYLFSVSANAADSSNVLSVDRTFFIELGIFIFVILFLNKFLFQPLLDLKENRDVETSVRIERAKSMDEQSVEIEAEYKKRISDFKAEIESSSNEKIVEAKKQAEDLIKRAKEESLIEIENARKSLDSELYLRIANISIDDVKRGENEVTLKIKELVAEIKGKI
jgi:F-type H+-transporting ATPase subunit b|tara:strand:+ start:26635 stop:27147 length:513 start_codon:yes stop_codon:yes gene_type:complete